MDDFEKKATSLPFLPCEEKFILKRLLFPSSKIVSMMKKDMYTHTCARKIVRNETLIKKFYVKSIISDIMFPLKDLPVPIYFRDITIYADYVKLNVLEISGRDVRIDESSFRYA